MKTKEHKPGPWIVEEDSHFGRKYSIKTTDGLIIAWANHGMSDVEGNAELMAKAPELLKEIQELREKVDLFEKVLPDGPETYKEILMERYRLESENASLRAEVERLKGAFDKEIIRLKQVLGSVRWDIAKDRCVTAVETISKEIGFIP